MSYIIDLSGNNKSPNYSALKSFGVNGAIIKIGQGAYASNGLAEHYKACKDSGFKVGGYWYAHTAVNIWDAAKDAETCIKIIKDKGLKFDYPIYLDLEGKDGGGSGLPSTISSEDLTRGVIIFTKLLQSAGLRAGIYTMPAFIIGKRFDLTAALKECGGNLWLAHWTNNPDIKSKYQYGQQLWQWGIINYNSSKNCYEIGNTASPNASSIDCNCNISLDCSNNAVNSAKPEQPEKPSVSDPPAKSATLEIKKAKADIVYNLRSKPIIEQNNIICKIKAGESVKVIKGSEIRTAGYTYRITICGDNTVGWSVINFNEV